MSLKQWKMHIQFKRVFTSVLAFPFMLVGCALNSPQSGGESGYLVRGTLTQEQDRYRFAVCGDSDSRPVELKSSVLVGAFAEHSLGDGWPVYVEAMAVKGAGDKLALRDPLVVGGSLSTCKHKLPGIELRAVSADGAAVFDLRERQIRVQFRDRLLQLGFKRSAVDRRGLERRWEQTMPGGGGRRERTLKLRIIPATCKGSSGAWYALSMTAELNDKTYHGCARLGDLEHWPLRQRYVTPDSISTRRLSLVLIPDGRFRLTEDYLNNQPVIEHIGRWERLSASRVRFSPDDTHARPFIFDVAADGRLSLSEFHPAYGYELMLEPAGTILRINSGELDWRQWR